MNMPRGITEQQVWDIADRLLLEGGRPTIERVRRELGTGSPNTVNKHLETWWRRLVERLREGTEAVKGRPPDVEKAFQALWRLAREEADAQAAAGLLQEQHKLADQATALTREKLALEHAREVQAVELRSLQEAAAAAERRLAAAEQARKELEDRLARLSADLQSAHRQRDKLAGQLENAKERLEGTERHLTAKIAEAQAAHDRDSRRHKGELERSAKQLKSEQEARQAAERALGKAEAELAASRREVATLTHSQDALTARLDQQAEQLAALTAGLKGFAPRARRGRPSRKST